MVHLPFVGNGLCPLLLSQPPPIVGVGTPLENEPDHTLHIHGWESKNQAIVFFRSVQAEHGIYGSHTPLRLGLLQDWQDSISKTATKRRARLGRYGLGEMNSY